MYGITRHTEMYIRELEKKETIKTRMKQQQNKNRNKNTRWKRKETIMSVVEKHRH